MDVLAGLDPEQVAAVQHPGAPLCIVAGAGSGKTRVLTARIAARIADGTAAAPHVLALTFTRRAAGELRARLARSGAGPVPAGTFHAVAHAQLRRRWADRGQAPPGVLASPMRVLRAVGAEPLALRDLAAEIGWAKARLVPPSRYAEAAAAAGRRPALPFEQVAEVYRSYEQAKAARVLLDLDDLLLACRRAMLDDEGFAAAVRWRVRHLFVDELQDANPAQLALVRAWLGDRHDLCVVGDPRQAVYGWNGADPSLLTRFVDHFPGASVVTLATNHRSAPPILAAAAGVLGVPVAPGGGQADGPPPTITEHADDDAESADVARRVRLARRPGTPWSDIAVLARTNAQLQVLADALRHAGIPVRTPGGPFLARDHVRLALRRLRQPRPVLPLAVHLADVAGAAAEATGAVRADLDELARLGQEYLALDGAGTGAGFAAWLFAGRVDGATGGDGVELVTFHRAKGLEWPVVFVTGLEDGLVPLSGVDPAGRAEEQRLLYVALTRAERALHCSWARARPAGAPRRPSPWLAAIEAAAAPPARPTDWRTRLDEQRRLLDTSDAAGDPRPAGGSATGSAPGPAIPPGPRADDLQRLEMWRSQVARAARAPVEAIADDRLVRAIAQARPATVEQLAAIPGLGPVRAARWAPSLLTVVAGESP